MLSTHAGREGNQESVRPVPRGASSLPSMAGLPPFTATSVVTESQLEPATALLLVVSAGLYAWGVRRLAARGRTWPARRSWFFVAGVVVLTIATQSGLATYDTTLFSVHVAQHLLLGMAGPMLLVLGAPVTLALQAANRPTQSVLVRTLHFPLIRLATHPLIAVLVFAATLFVLYLSPLYEASLRNDLVHTTVHLHFLGAGVVFFIVVLGTEPTSWRIPYGARLALVLVTIPLHAFLGIILLSAQTPIAADYYDGLQLSWTLDPLLHQQIGGGLLWAVGDVFALAVVVTLMVGWMAEDNRSAARVDRRLHGALH